MYIKPLLKKLYLKQQHSIKEIEKQTNLKNVSKLLNKYQITKRTSKENFKIFIIGACNKHRNPNIDYYSNLEKSFEEILTKDLNLVKNKDFFHDHYLPPTKCQADFFFPILNLDIEIDCSIWHKNKDHSKRDIKLKNLLSINVIRFDENHIKNKLELITKLKIIFNLLQTQEGQIPKF